MKNILFFTIILVCLIGCGKKSDPEYQGLKLDNKITINL